jgi:hypothetical protein
MQEPNLKPATMQVALEEPPPVLLQLPRREVFPQGVEPVWSALAACISLPGRVELDSGTAVKWESRHNFDCCRDHLVWSEFTSLVG